jgi:threonine/homoserine/homoserine lactone efflux protein
MILRPSRLSNAANQFLALVFLLLGFPGIPGAFVLVSAVKDRKRFQDASWKDWLRTLGGVLLVLFGTPFYAFLYLSMVYARRVVEE